MVVTTSGAVTPGSLEALKLVKATETEWETRVTGAREEAGATLRRLRDEGDAAVKAAEEEVERQRVARLDAARAEVASEVETILAEGRTAAEHAAHNEGRRPMDKKDALLETVLGSFGKD
jgi:vacuolar-type H+-ATPase subunit H